MGFGGMAVVRSVLAVAGTATTLAAAWVVYRRWRLHRSSIKSIPTPPEHSMFFGHFYALFGTRAGETHKRWIQQYGDIVKFDIFVAGIRIAISSPEAIRRVLVSNAANYIKMGFSRGFMRRLMMHSLCYATGESHKRHANIISQAFRFESISSLSPQFSSHADNLVNHWLQQMHSRPASSSASPCFLEVDMKRAMYDLSLNILSISGYGLHSNSDEQAELLAAYEDTLACGSMTLSSVIYHTWPFNLLPLPGLLRDNRARRRMRAAVGAIIRRRREALAAAAGDAAATARLEGDLLGLMLRATTESAAAAAAPPPPPPHHTAAAPSPPPPAAASDGLSDEEVRDNLIAFLMLGHAPTAICLCWTMYLLAKNPAAAARVRAEAQQRAAAAGGGRPLTARDLEHMPFLAAVIKESLRLYPPVPISARTLQAQDCLCGHALEAGTHIVLPIMVLQRLPSLWNRPDEFVPRRFMPGSKTDKDRDQHAYKWCPFLAGPRKCMASHFAQIQVGLVVATILSRVHLEVPRDHPEPYGRHGELLLNAHPYVRLRVSPLPTGPCTTAPADAAGAGPAP